MVLSIITYVFGLLQLTFKLYLVLVPMPMIGLQSTFKLYLVLVPMPKIENYEKPIQICFLDLRNLFLVHIPKYNSNIVMKYQVQTLFCPSSHKQDCKHCASVISSSLHQPSYHSLNHTPSTFQIKL